MDQPQYLVSDFSEPLTLAQMIAMRNKLIDGPLREELTKKILEVQVPGIEAIAQSGNSARGFI